MSFANNKGIKIFWDEEGHGPALLLIAGMGCPAEMWLHMRPSLSARYRTIVLDNRGTGQSDVPPGPYSVALMASDAAAVLDAAGIEAAHVFGISMGGIVAQEFALQYPARLRSLIIGCASFGGRHAVRPEAAVRQFLAERGNMSAGEAEQASVPIMYCAQSPRSRIDHDLALRRSWHTRSDAYQAQLQGVVAWESYSRLPQIALPTLVIHGDSDRLVPPENGRLLVARIPGAKLVTLCDAGHLFLVDQSEAARDAIVEFISAVEAAEGARPSRQAVHTS
ncbi:MAG: alpha/beta fold hydrolase [Candidatus Korobacteraceae bacterium]|jgi:pimeloyl-ACP methyl ester carboxylesterase